MDKSELKKFSKKLVRLADGNSDRFEPEWERFIPICVDLINENANQFRWNGTKLVPMVFQVPEMVKAVLLECGSDFYADYHQDVEMLTDYCCSVFKRKILSRHYRPVQGGRRICVV